MSIDHKTYKETVERSFDEYRKHLGKWRVRTEATEHGGGEPLPLDKYGRPGRVFTSKAGFTELYIEGRGNSYGIITGPQSSGWFIYVPAMDVLCAVPDCEDYFHNKYALGRAMGALDALSIAEGVCSYFRDRQSCHSGDSALDA